MKRREVKQPALALAPFHSKQVLPTYFYSTPWEPNRHPKEQKILP